MVKNSVRRSRIEVNPSNLEALGFLVVDKLIHPFTNLSEESVSVGRSPRRLEIP
jgi:hypothetical protein